MRIGYYIPAWPPGAVANGIVTTLGYLGEALRELGHQVMFVTPYVADGREPDDRVFVLPPMTSRSFVDTLRFKVMPERAIFMKHSEAIAAAVDMLASEQGIEIFQMEETQGWALNVIDKVRVPVVVRLHGPWFLNRELGLNRRERVEDRNRVAREGQAISAAAAIAAPSKDVLVQTAKFYGEQLSFARVIPNPIPSVPCLERWSPADCDRDLLLFVGRFDRIKGADLVLRAFESVGRRRENLRLLFVGPDVGLRDENSVPMSFDTFVHRNISSSVASRIQFLGRLERSQIAELRRRAYVTIIGSRYETFGNVAIEAMTFGCPIVATGVGGISEILTNRRNALLVEPDSDQFASAIDELLDNPALAVSLANQAATDCRDQFDPLTIGRKTIEFYSAILDSWRRSGQVRSN